MGMWMELHCDGDIFRSDPPCYSSQNSNICDGLVRSTNQDIQIQTRFLREKAKKAGWIQKKEGKWLCPACSMAEEE